MFRKLTIALAATLALGAAALAPSAASAKHFGGMGGMGGFHHFHHFGGIGIGVGYADDSCLVTQRVMTPYGYRLRTVNVCEY
jgi:Spy/CpxP family protein refolding chaperone